MACAFLTVFFLSSLCGFYSSSQATNVKCSNITAVCNSSANFSVPLEAIVYTNSTNSTSITNITISSSCVRYLWTLQCIAQECDVTVNSYYATCQNVLTLECANLSLICSNFSGCPFSLSSSANCSSNNLTTVAPPTEDDTPPYGLLSLEGLISVIVVGVVAVVMATLLVCCVCWCCRSKSAVKVNLTGGDDYTGMTAMNPLTLEDGDPVPISKPRPVSIEQSIDGVFTVSNVEVDDKGLIQSYVLAESDRVELTALLGGAVLPSNLFTTLEVLKNGVFHTTFKAHYKKVYTDGTTFTKDVVSKTVKGYSTRSDLVEYLELVSMTKAFNHPNIMSIVGVVLDCEDSLPQVVRGYSIRGDVRSYVRSMRRSVAVGDGMPENLNEPELVRLCYEVSIAMQYLANNNYTHGNLKARNCLLDDSLNVKVADFCPVQDSKETGYLVSSMARWLAPEVFTNHKFSLQSDVWSYAVVCWEVFNLGRVPYYGMEIVDLPHLLKKGLRLEQPMLSPQIIYGLMCFCWEWDPQRRPTTNALNQKMTEIYRKYTSNN